MKKIVVLGGGESGVGAAILAKKKGFNVYLSDKNQIQDKYRNILLKNFIRFEEGFHNENIIMNSDIIIKSPGISNKLDLIKKIQFNKIELISEIEFASRYVKSPIIAITGSNGKTTTSKLIYYILKEAGLNVALVGNIGKSFSFEVACGNFDYYIVEVSSFQLENCYSFTPYIAAIINLSPDHLDSYDYQEYNYYYTKFKIVQSCNRSNVLILHKEDVIIKKLLKELNIESKIIFFSMLNDINNVSYIRNTRLFVNMYPMFSINIKDLQLKGIHNIMNIIVSIIVAKLLGINNKQIKIALQNFSSLEYRLEKIFEINNIIFINDSKSTNINSLYYALISIHTPIILILGGVDKGNCYKKVVNLINQKVRKIVCLGIDNTIIKKTFGSTIEIFDTFSMQECVKLCYSIANQGDTVLLSPACASFDLFKNFEDRGKQFTDEVMKLNKI